jgi:hypothetical protein
MADRYLIENREAAVGVQMLYLWQGSAGELRSGGRKRRSSFVSIGRSAPCLVGKRLSRDAQADTAAEAPSCRSHAGGSGNGGGLGFDEDIYSWGAGCWVRRRRGSRRPALVRLSRAGVVSE